MGVSNRSTDRTARFREVLRPESVHARSMDTVRVNLSRATIASTVPSDRPSIIERTFFSNRAVLKSPTSSSLSKSCDDIFLALRDHIQWQLPTVTSPQHVLRNRAPVAHLMRQHQRLITLQAFLPLDSFALQRHSCYWPSEQQRESQPQCKAVKFI